jgi:hypothetical protein
MALSPRKKHVIDGADSLLSNGRQLSKLVKRPDTRAASEMSSAEVFVHKALEAYYGAVFEISKDLQLRPVIAWTATLISFLQVWVSG